MIDIEARLSKRLNRKNPPQHLPAVLRAVASFAIDPPELFTTADVSRRTIKSFDKPQGLSMHIVHKEMHSLMDFSLVQTCQEGYPHNPIVRAVMYARTNPENWAIAMEVLDTLRPVQTTDIERPLQ